MTDTLTTRLQKAVSLRDAATPAPWFRNVIGTGFGAAVLCDVELKHSTESDKFRICTVPIYGNLEGNAELIAAAPSIVQLAVELGAEVARVTALNTELTKHLRQALDLCADAEAEIDELETELSRGGTRGLK